MLSSPGQRAAPPAAAAILTPEAQAFLTGLERRFGTRRRELLALRALRQERLDAGEMPDFLPGTKGVREGAWTVAPPPADLVDRRVEITAPVDRKMMVNALNSGANVYMADFEDSFSPVWAATLQGQQNLVDAVERTLSFTAPDGKPYTLNETLATLVVRPRGWHLDEPGLNVDGQPMSASLLDAGLFLFHCGRRLLDRGSGPYLYLPKMESHLEARLWNDVLAHAEEELGLPAGSVRVTVLIETVLAAFEMDEILHELRTRACGLNAGRWDYLFSLIKAFGNHRPFILPDRHAIHMTAPFLRAYTDLLVKTCHRRGAHAIGGMSAYIPRRDPRANQVALDQVRRDKEREARDGFDGTWVAHPALVPVARAVFDATLVGRPHQLHRDRGDAAVTTDDLLRVHIPHAQATHAGLRRNAAVALRYLDHWLRGVGAVAIDDLMEDTATAEIARAQVWQWIRHHVPLEDWSIVTPELVLRVVDEEHAKAKSEAAGKHRLDDARQLFLDLVVGHPFPTFLTLAARPQPDA